MQRNKATYNIADGQYASMKCRMLNWSKPFSILVYLDSNGYADRYGRYECLLAAGAHDKLPVREGLEGISGYHKLHNDWLFGHINYDYKNELEPKLLSRHDAVTGFEEMSFFCPETVCYITKDKTKLVIETLAGDPGSIYDAITHASADLTAEVPPAVFSGKTSREQYLETVNCLRAHIKEGDCYEINYCNEYYAKGLAIDPLGVFNRLNGLSRAPFAAYYRNGQSYLMCTSPERYLQKSGRTLVSQPIKGTARRGDTTEADKLIKQDLAESIKDRAENVMITDLVRNDLARSCATGSIAVDELFRIYTFPQVHQMISTVTGIMEEGRAITDAIRFSFPMGSMTGAPKVKVMQLTEQYEESRRELYSGTVGYISPDGDFDFNVVIRSLFYNAAGKYLCYQAGGAITYDSNPEAEWEEMRLKGWAMEKIFASGQ